MVRLPPVTRAQGFATLELVVAIGILAGAMLPLAYSFVQEQRLARAYYYRAIAIELVDGEMESLVAGEWRKFPAGRHPYSVRGGASTNLPPGAFVLAVQPGQLQLEWRPAQPGRGGPVTRSVSIPP